LVSPAQKKQAVAYGVGKRLCSKRRACRYLDVHRSTYRYSAQPLRPRQIQLQDRIVALSWQYPRYGYRRIRALMAQEGWSVSRKQVQRIRRKEGLKVRRKPKRICRQGVSTGLPTQTTGKDLSNGIIINHFLSVRDRRGGGDYRRDTAQTPQLRTQIVTD
jgi:putative transposase